MSSYTLEEYQSIYPNDPNADRVKIINQARELSGMTVADDADIRFTETDSGVVCGVPLGTHDAIRSLFNKTENK